MTCPETCQHMALASPVLSDLKIAFEIYTSQIEIADKLWTYFQAVTLAVAGFTIGSNKVTNSRQDARLVIGIYLLFCLGNFSALCVAQGSLVALAAAVSCIAEKLGITVNISPLDRWQIALYYWAVAAAVSSGIYCLTRSRTKTSPLSPINPANHKEL